MKPRLLIVTNTILFFAVLFMFVNLQRANNLTESMVVKFQEYETAFTGLCEVSGGTLETVDDPSNDLGRDIVCLYPE